MDIPECNIDEQTIQKFTKSFLLHFSTLPEIFDFALCYSKGINCAKSLQIRTKNCPKA